MNEVCKLTSLSRTAINKHRSAGNFPAPVRISEKRIAFVESEVLEWIDHRVAARHEAA
ncbi:MAG: AlpA family phage regulatory protein [Notoacmeibacter sp.]|nr:AlpA family phage regulatory protein [Notoacmeibacter sp.]